jgi:hypothetical protein
MENVKKVLSPEQHETQLKTLQGRFEKNKMRHVGMEWAKVQARLQAHPEKLWSLHAMEQSGGEPDVVVYDEIASEFIFYDCSAETPKGRTNVCYDREAQDARKKFPPECNAVEMATEMGIQLLSEEEYRELQQLGMFDLKTSSWIKATPEVRKLGGALFADRRYGRVFVYHNGADSYYGARGFRGSLRV